MSSSDKEKENNGNRTAMLPMLQRISAQQFAPIVFNAPQLPWRHMRLQLYPEPQEVPHIDVSQLPSDYQHAPTDLRGARATVERECAIPAAVESVRKRLRNEAQQNEPSATYKQKKSVTFVRKRICPFDDDAVVHAQCKRLREDGDAASDEQLEQFVRNKHYAHKALGTRLHGYIELHLRGVAIPPQLVDGAFRQFLRFYRECIDANGLVPWRVEHRVYGKQWDGIVDALFVKRDRSQQYVWLFDWKRSPRPIVGGDGDSDARCNRARAPFEHMPNNAATKYWLQLNMLRRATHDHHQKRTRVRVGGMFVCRFFDYGTEDESTTYELVHVVGNDALIQQLVNVEDGTPSAAPHVSVC